MTSCTLALQPLAGFLPWLVSHCQRFVSLTLGTLLLIAAGLKAWTPPPAGSSAFFGPGLIAAEFLLGVALLTNFTPRITSLLALLAFSAFSAHSLVAALEGQPSCGCFGKAGVAPSVMLAVDLAAVAALLLARPRWWQAGCAALVFCLAFVLASGEGNPSPQSFDDSDIPLIERTRFPFAALEGAPPDLARGEWKVVFHRAGCDECENLLKRLAAESAAPRGMPDGVLLVSVVGRDGQKPASFSAFSTSLAANNWRNCSTRRYVPTPTVVRVRGGLVVSVDRPVDRSSYSLSSGGDK